MHSMFRLDTRTLDNNRYAIWMSLLFDLVFDIYVMVDKLFSGIVFLSFFIIIRLSVVVANGVSRANNTILIMVKLIVMLYKILCIVIK